MKGVGVRKSSPQAPVGRGGGGQTMNLHYNLLFIHGIAYISSEYGLFGFYFISGNNISYLDLKKEMFGLFNYCIPTLNFITLTSMKLWVAVDLLSRYQDLLSLYYDLLLTLHYDFVSRYFDFNNLVIRSYFLFITTYYLVIKTYYLFMMTYYLVITTYFLFSTT